MTSSEKIVNSAHALFADWRREGQTLVFTNGVFDILHKGHCKYLMEAADLGDKLIVGLNSDESVRMLNKGPQRPINDENSRAYVLSCLYFVDAVVVFNDETPLELIKAIKPNILVKGGDYDSHESDPDSKKFIVGSDVVRAGGGKVVTIPLVDGFSTTSVIEKMKNG